MVCPCVGVLFKRYTCTSQMNQVSVCVVSDGCFFLLCRSVLSTEHMSKLRVCLSVLDLTRHLPVLWVTVPTIQRVGMAGLPKNRVIGPHLLVRG